uniref:Uncharacterized protein n=1 Tax=Nelumbo nucifera TaxID=4432 RepID=A0A822XUA4_NELNU|nr:TPA_asm: hypothetical protein HUJ06_025035 [Nelumbo nucifera]
MNGVYLNSGHWDPMGSVVDLLEEREREKEDQ